MVQVARAAAVRWFLICLCQHFALGDGGAAGGRRLRRQAPRRAAAVRLDDAQLGAIYSVSCLQAKQRDPDFPCQGADAVPAGALKAIGTLAPTPAPLDLGNFPAWGDPRCHSESAPLCDPDALLQADERRALAKAVKGFPDAVSVTCTHQATDGRRRLENHTRPFNLAVVVLGAWPASESDPASLQTLGDVVLSRWGLTPGYNGVDTRSYRTRVYSWDEYYANCPNAAALIVLPSIGEAFLASPAASCEFVCPERGGAEVAAAVTRALRSGEPLRSALEAGVQATAETVRAAAGSPLSASESPFARDRRTTRDFAKRRDRFLNSQAYYTILLWTALLCSLGIGIFAVAAFAYYNFVPTPATLRKVG